MDKEELKKEVRECLCQLCDREYPVWFAPSDIWNKVMRQGGHISGDEEYPFVCPSCFAFKYEEEVNPNAVWMLSLENRLVYSSEEVERLCIEARIDEIKHLANAEDDFFACYIDMESVDIRERVEELESLKENKDD